MHTRHAISARAILATAALVVTLVVVGAAPAFAHASLLSTERRTAACTTRHRPK